jgi:hypothetical protein
VIARRPPRGGPLLASLPTHRGLPEVLPGRPLNGQAPPGVRNVRRISLRRADSHRPHTVAQPQGGGRPVNDCRAAENIGGTGRVYRQAWRTPVRHKAPD